jgi:hypothetical protein
LSSHGACNTDSPEQPNPISAGSGNLTGIASTTTGHPINQETLHHLRQQVYKRRRKFYHAFVSTCIFALSQQHHLPTLLSKIWSGGSKNP